MTKLGLKWSGNSSKVMSLSVAVEWEKEKGILSERYSSRIIDRTYDKLDVRIKEEEILVNPRFLS